MRREEFHRLIEQWHQERLKLMDDRGHDYSDEDNIFANFERVAQIAEILDLDVRGKSYNLGLLFVLHKLDRIINLVNKVIDSPRSEPLADIFRDLHNYLDLTEGMLVKKGKGIELKNLSREW